MGKSRSARAQVARDRELQVMQLKRMGGTHTQIADKLGITKQRVSQIWQKQLALLQKETTEEASVARTIELDRVDAMLRTAWPLATGKQPNLKWFDRAMSCIEMRSKLLGLFSPSRLPDGSGAGVDSGEYTITITAPANVQPE